METIKLDLTVLDVNKILGVLTTQPYVEVVELIDVIKAQGNEQINKAKAKTSKPNNSVSKTKKENK